STASTASRDSSPSASCCLPHRFSTIAPAEPRRRRRPPYNPTHMRKRSSLGTVLVAGALLVSAGIAARAGQSGEQVANGRGLFQTRCADCHGIDGKGVHGPDLTVIFAAGATDDRVFQTIRRGVPGSEMPASNAPDAEIREVIAYLHSVAVRGSEADAGTNAANLANGERLFNTSCAACHRVNGRGGVLGPDLSRVGAARSRALLMQDIRDASAVIAPGYQAVTLTRNDGRQVRGTRKNEDAYSIQIMDTSEQLQGYRKSDLKTVVAEKKSLMQDFAAARVSNRDLADL